MGEFFDNNRCLLMIVGGGFVLVAAILVIVLPMSFSTLEYHEYGFKRQKSTGSVDTTTVYSGGKYLIGPDAEFKVFRADAHFLSVYDITVFTYDKLEVKVTANFQYFLRKDELPLLHDAYDLYYEDVMKSNAGAITTFNTRDLFSKRAEAEEMIGKAVSQRLGGTCCRKDCNEYRWACVQGCIPATSCDDSLRGLNANVKFFQLSNVRIPREVEEQFMTTIILGEKDLREKLLQNATIIRKSTNAEVQDIKNKASEVVQNSTAEAQRIFTVSQAEYTNTIETARSTGLKRLYSDLKISNQEQKNSFDYLRTLRGLKNVHLTVDFDQRIAGSLN
ncbi:hypothetical protein MAR_007474 [Mya arenaria]|uniref:Band 7 domain-containing protein n=1 Tax=Mya arenaria TaxID=6604 RepID=A0ABY7DDK0_MYAAR|nr:hypothetical protein MAR_007474 [Mya arenaria]